jgi:hypothetical protein
LEYSKSAPYATCNEGTVQVVGSFAPEKDSKPLDAFVKLFMNEPPTMNLVRLLLHVLARTIDTVFSGGIKYPEDHERPSLEIEMQYLPPDTAV